MVSMAFGDEARIFYSILLLVFSTLVVMRIIMPSLLMSPTASALGIRDKPETLKVRRLRTRDDGHLRRTMAWPSQANPDETIMSLRGLEDNQDAHSEEHNHFFTHIVPTIILTIAIVIISCTLTQYGCDLYHHFRIRNGSRLEKNEADFENDDARKKNSSSLTTTAASHSNASGNDSQSIQRKTCPDERLPVQNRQIFHRIPQMLPPLLPEINELEAISPLQESLSRVSTLTNSLIEGNMSFGENGSQRLGGIYHEEDGPSKGAKEDITELSVDHRLPREGNISNFLVTAKECEQGSPKLAVEESQVNEAIEEKVSRLTTAGDEQIQEEARDKSIVSTYSSLTEKTSSEEEEDESYLHGEDCLERPDEPISFLSLERSPDTRQSKESVGRDINIVGRLLFGETEDGNEDAMDLTSLERRPGATDVACLAEEAIAYFNHYDLACAASSSPIDLVSGHDYTRDIYFVAIPKRPCLEDCKGGVADDNEIKDAADVLGLKLLNASCAATHPSVAEVLSHSPLVGRIFEGDFILKVNGKDVTGYSRDELETLLVQESCKSSEEDDRSGDISESSSLHLSYQMINLTIMSSKCDLQWEEGSSSDGSSLDLGVVESGVEF